MENNNVAQREEVHGDRRLDPSTPITVGAYVGSGLGTLIGLHFNYDLPGFFIGFSTGTIVGVAIGLMFYGFIHGCRCCCKRDRRNNNGQNNNNVGHLLQRSEIENVQQG